MTKAFWDVITAKEKYGIDMRTASYVVAIGRVVDAMKARGFGLLTIPIFFISFEFYCLVI